MSLRITVTDERTGDSDTVRIPEGDFFLTCHDPCRLDGVQKWKSGTVQITIKDHRPQQLPDEPESDAFMEVS